MMVRPLGVMSWGDLPRGWVFVREEGARCCSLPVVWRE
jgi:hypothetical protein